jgi:CRP-like cAMP-binding protein
MERDNTLYKMFGKFYPQGTILYSENDSGEEMFYIQSGRVVLKERKDGTVREKSLGPGALLGEECYSERSARRSAAEVTEDSRLLVIGPGNIAGVSRNGPELSAEIMNCLLKGLDKAWKDLRRWQETFSLKKIEAFFRDEDRTRSWRIEEVSELTNIEESGVRRIFEDMVEAGALSSEGDDFRLSGETALEEFFSRRSVREKMREGAA